MRGLATTLVAAGMSILAGGVAVGVEPEDDAGSGSDHFWVRGVEESTDSKPGGAADSIADVTPSGDPTEIVLIDGACTTDVPVAGEFFEARFCEVPSAPAVTLGTIRTAFTRLDLPAGTLTIQPPDGLTLVNFDTNFFTTDTRPLTRTVTLLGQQVTIEATPATFTWTFGDGEKLSTTDPGAAYPDLRVTHNYRLKDTYRPSLATTYTGRYRLGSGPWRAIPGTVTINGAPQPLRAIEATPKLVGY